ncbi:MAG: rhomboid family intramembrane serine protease [Candidatus Hadarchaeales archaeon]
MRFRGLLVGFGGVGKAVLVVIVLSFLSFAWTSLFSSLLPFFSLSRSHPWGILTALFTHADADHLLSNLFSLSLFSLLFVLLHLPRRVEAREDLSLAFALSLFLAGAGVNVVDFLSRRFSGSPSSSCGSSGMVYAVMGMVMVSSIYNLFLFSSLSLRHSSFRFPLLLAASPSAAVLLVFSWELLLHPSSFFSVSPSANVLAHVLGFLYGAVIFSAVLVGRPTRRPHPYRVRFR